MPIESQSPGTPLDVLTGATIDFNVTTRLPTGPNVVNEIGWQIQAPGDPSPRTVASNTQAYRHRFEVAGDRTLTSRVAAGTNFIKPAKCTINIRYATWTVRATSAVPTEVSPPGAPQPLIFTGPTDLVWEDAAASRSTSFNLYRGNVQGPVSPPA